MTTTRTTATRTTAGQETPWAWISARWNSPLTTYYLLVGTTVVLMVMGLVMVLSSSSVDSIVDGESPYTVFLAQAQFTAVGLVLMWLGAHLRAEWQHRFAMAFLAFSLVLQLLIFIPGVGVESGGNRNWIKIGPITGQPSEVLKLAVALWLGVVLTRKAHLLRQGRQVLGALLGAFVALIAVLSGKDMGTTLIMLLLIAGAAFVAGVPSWMFGVGGGTALAGVALFIVTQPNSNRFARITSWLSGECLDATGLCFQTQHGTWALASGGLVGAGLGGSREKWSYLPAADNDFIFAVIGEELGLVGTLLVLGLFGLLAVALLRVISSHPDPMARITTGAIFAWVIGQALINIAVVINFAPVVGVPLPLVSSGGSSLIMTMAALGVVISYARSVPQTAEALATRAKAVRRSIAILGRPRG